MVSVRCPRLCPLMCWGTLVASLFRLLQTALQWRCGCVYLFELVLSLFGQVLGGGIAGSYHSSVFNFLWSLHTVFHSDCNFSHLLAFCLSWLEKRLPRFSAQFLVNFVWHSVVLVPYVLWILISYQIYHWWISSLIQYVVFSFCWWFLFAFPW